MGNSSSQDMPPPVTVAAQARHTATVSSCFHPMTDGFTILSRQTLRGGFIRPMNHRMITLV